MAGVALALGAAAIYEAAKLPIGTLRNPGQGFFPWWTSFVIVLLALVLLFQALTHRLSARQEEPGRVAKSISLLVALAAYAFLLDPVGYMLCTFLVVLFMLRVTNPQRLWVALGMAALTAVGSYIVFAVWLSVPLPRGPL
jgi:putative tricarboxylic transport membrane protein